MKKVKISLKRKLIILCTLLLIIPTITIGISTYSTSKKELTASGKEELQQSTNMVIAMIALLNQEVEAGNLTLEEAQEKLRVELYGKKTPTIYAQLKKNIRLEVTVLFMLSTRTLLT